MGLLRTTRHCDCKVRQRKVSGVNSPLGASLHRTGVPASSLESTRPRGRQRGQSLAEFALIFPVMLLVVIAIADFGRIFSAEVAIEAAAREGSDYGAMLGNTGWASSAAPWTTNDTEIRRRVCAAASRLPAYDNSGGNCSQNPSVSWELLDWNKTTNTYSVIDPATGDCSGRPALADPCVVHVTATYVFTPLVPILPIAGSFTIRRDSWFAVSDLGT